MRPLGSASAGVVTGAGSGLGRAAAVALAATGVTVFAIDRDPAVIDTGATARGKIVGIEADVSDEHSVAQAFDLIAATVGRVDVCVNAAGISPARKILDRDGPIPMAELRKVLDVNLFGTLDVARRCAVLMSGNERPAGGNAGVIINVSSGAATQGQKGQLAYAASKAAVVGAMLPMARDLAGHGIRVVTIAPGLFDTGMSKAFPEQLREGLAQMVLYPKRMGNPEEFGKLVLHIVENHYLNATTISLDGGVRMT